jgi:hypothetical protein
MHAAERTSVEFSPTVLSPHFPSFSFGRPVRLMPRTWHDDIIMCARYFSSWRELDGSSVTSRERDFGVHGAYSAGIVTGDVVAEELPWLDNLYRTTILDAVNELGLGRYTTATDVRAAVNINSIDPGGRYEWHVDSNPLTALLFVTTHEPDSGGELVFRPDPRFDSAASWEHVVTPVSGDLLVFDAREAAHGVMPLGGAQTRITVPMNYYLTGDAAVRPADLDGYLYD